MWKKLRIFILLMVLFIVGADTYLTKFRAISWEETLWVAVYPINPDNDPAISRYISGLSNRNFAQIEQFFAKEASDYGLPLNKPFKMMLAHEVNELPPPPPERGSHALQMGWWSLKLRKWAWSMDESGFSPHIKMFIVYHPYARNKELPHSLGMEKGMIGVVQAFAHREMEGKNNLVIAHEMLHTIGSTDKYDYETLEPRYPDGYAEPDKTPRYPQRYAELMGGRTPLSESTSFMPRSLRGVTLGTSTAKEINWLTGQP